MMNVLIVEDDLSIADLLQEALEAEGYGVCGIVRTVKEAMGAAWQSVIDFAIIDIRLADQELGTEVAARLRMMTNARIIFSTGNDNVAHLTAQDGDAIMTKPYRMRDLGRGLKIVDDIARFGETHLTYPRNFRMLDQPA